MDSAAANAPLFIEAFYDACESLVRANPALAVPELARINRILSDSGTGYQVQPPNLVSSNTHIPIEVPAHPVSLDEEAQEIIQRSLRESEQLLSEGRNRPAVQEVLWLLETVSTAFQGLDSGKGTVQGRYFNKIVGIFVDTTGALLSNRF